MWLLHFSLSSTLMIVLVPFSCLKRSFHRTTEVLRPYFLLTL
jgi:hypothetical protein